MVNSNSKRLLLLGGSHAEIPLIKAAQKLGYYVITTGNARDGLGHPVADKNIFADFSDKEQMLSIARAEGVSAVCSGCNDFALLSTVFVTEKLGLKGHDSLKISETIHHKDKFRVLAEKLEIASPKAVQVKSIEDLEKALLTLKFPLIIKPVDLTGGKGVRRVETAEEAMDAYHHAFERTRESHIIVEEFIEGTNHGFSAFLVDQKVAFYFSDNEQYYLNKYMVSGANSPTIVCESSLKRLCTYSEKIAQDLQLVDGILHIQFIEHPTLGPYIIEICRRPPGDLYIQFVEYATGVPYPEYLILAETGADVHSIKQAPTKGFWLRHCIMAKEEGVLEDVYFAPEIKSNVFDKLLWHKKGEKVEDKLYYKAGIVFLKFDSLKEMQEKTTLMNEYIQCKISPIK